MLFTSSIQNIHYFTKTVQLFFSFLTEKESGKGSNRLLTFGSKSKGWGPAGGGGGGGGDFGNSGAATQPPPYPPPRLGGGG